MKIIVICVVILVVFFIYKIHTSAMKLDNALFGEDELRDYENEYFLNHEEKRILSLYSYVEEHNALPPNIEKVSISEKAKEILYQKVKKIITDKINDELKYSDFDINDRVDADHYISRMIDRVIYLMYK